MEREVPLFCGEAVVSYRVADVAELERKASPTFLVRFVSLRVAFRCFVSLRVASLCFVLLRVVCSALLHFASWERSGIVLGFRSVLLYFASFRFVSRCFVLFGFASLWSASFCSATFRTAWCCLAVALFCFVSLCFVLFGFASLWSASFRSASFRTARFCLAFALFCFVSLCFVLLRFAGIF